MSKTDLIKLRKSIKKVQDSKRYEHTLGVAYTAAALAMRYEEDILNAQIAGFLHDCAKCLKEEKIIDICEMNNLPISEVERRNPYLLHAKAGAVLAVRYLVYLINTPLRADKAVHILFKQVDGGAVGICHHSHIVVGLGASLDLKAGDTGLGHFVQMLDHAHVLGV